MHPNNAFKIHFVTDQSIRKTLWSCFTIVYTHSAFKGSITFVIDGVIWATIHSLYSVNTSRNLAGGAGGGDIPGQSDRPVPWPHGAGGGHHWGLDTSHQKTEEGWDTR